MGWLHWLTSLGFISNRHGHIAMSFALLLPLLGIAGGAAVDLTRLQKLTAESQRQLDGAVLVAAQSLNEFRHARFKNGVYPELTDEQARERLLSYLAQQQNAFDPETLRVKVSKDGSRLEASAPLSVPTFILRLVGRPTLERALISIAVREEGWRMPMELALAYEQALSPGRELAPRMIAVGAIELLSKLEKAAPTEGFRASLVPFAGAANVAAFIWAQDMSPGSWPISAAERPADEIDAEVLPSDAVFTVRADHESPEAPIIGLNSQPGRLVELLAGGMPGTNVRPDHGVVWAWRTLSHRWNPHWPEPARAAHYEANVDKVLVLATGGPFARMTYDGTRGTDGRLKFFCERVRGKGISIYIAAVAPSPEDLTALQACAGDPNRVIVSETVEKAPSALNRIADALMGRMQRYQLVRS